MEQRDIDSLEILIDRHGLHDIIAAMVTIALAKAGHVLETWDDPRLAKEWEKAARTLDTVITKLPDLP